MRATLGPNFTDLKDLNRDLSLHTICEEARCPNIYECWENRTATFLILGADLHAGLPLLRGGDGAADELDLEEPERVAQAVRHLRLRHVVITSVARDDLADGGACVFADTIRAIRRDVPDCSVEVLIPDLQGSDEGLRDDRRGRAGDPESQRGDGGAPATQGARQGALRALPVGPAADQGAATRPMRTKSGMMLGVGERAARGGADDARPARRRRGHPHPRAVPAPQPDAPGGGALRPAARVRRAEGHRPGAGIPPRRVRPPGAQLVPRPRAGGVSAGWTGAPGTAVPGASAETPGSQGRRRGDGGRDSHLRAGATSSAGSAIELRRLAPSRTAPSGRGSGRGRGPSPRGTARKRWRWSSTARCTPWAGAPIRPTSWRGEAALRARGRRGLLDRPRRRRHLARSRAADRLSRSSTCAAWGATCTPTSSPSRGC